jgi:hypothetical protein
MSFFVVEFDKDLQKEREENNKHEEPQQEENDQVRHRLESHKSDMGQQSFLKERGQEVALLRSSRRDAVLI